MSFSLTKSIELLRNTPHTIKALLYNLSQEWTDANEGMNTWTTKEVIAHLILCEQRNWLPRAKIMLSQEKDKTLTVINMHDHFNMAKSNSLTGLLYQFEKLRQENIAEVTHMNLTEADLQAQAVHPTLGTIQLKEMFAAWVTHDLTHLAQIARVLAKQNIENVGPFIKFLHILEVNPAIVAVQANYKDLPVIFQLFEAAIAFQKKNNYIGWKDYDQKFLIADVENGQLFKITKGTEIACIFSICYQDPLIWREKENADAIYLHRIVLNRDFAGQQWFTKVLDWAKGYAKQKSLKYIRMDTWANNFKLIDYYRSHGFRFVENYTTGNSANLPLQHRNLKVALLEFELAV